MQQIIQPNESILKILGPVKSSDAQHRFSHYCVSTKMDKGVLLFNTLTRELVLLTAEEYSCGIESQELRRRRFVVPCDMDERKLVSMARWVYRSTQRETGIISNYTILTTMDCNARCFYCYEMGRARTPMSAETAKKTAEFIASHCGGKPVKISWFGGEPLYNYPVIDLISDSLQEKGVRFTSSMISNGYLFDREMIQRALSKWNLKRVQITLDGTEEVYNRCKAFIYKGTSAYQVVTGNIEQILQAGIDVTVRMNMDFHNSEDLMVLTRELASRFGQYSGFHAYSHLIFDENTPWDQRYSFEKWTALYHAQAQLEQNLTDLGISNVGKTRLKRVQTTSQCMADNSNCIVITPTGDLSVCEHFSDRELVGHIDQPERNQAVVQSFRQCCEEIPECSTCFYYPQCIRLKKCPDLIPCLQPERDKLLKKIQTAMNNEYEMWKEDSDKESTDLNDNDLT